MAKTDTTVKELVELVKKGELRLPEMQRRYVWTSTRVRDLLDSLYRRYPSGTILVIRRLIMMLLARDLSFTVLATLYCSANSKNYFSMGSSA